MSIEEKAQKHRELSRIFDKLIDIEYQATIDAQYTKEHMVKDITEVRKYLVTSELFATFAS